MDEKSLCMDFCAEAARTREKRYAQTMAAAMAGRRCQFRLPGLVGDPLTRERRHILRAPGFGGVALAAFEVMENGMKFPEHSQPLVAADDNFAKRDALRPPSPHF